MDVQHFLSSNEGRAVVNVRVNVLLVLGRTIRDEVVTTLAPLLQEPVRAVEGWPSDGLPAKGTLIVRAIQNLTMQQQRAMLAWFRHTRRRVQMISLTAGPLFPRVLSGDFLAELYYHLNTVYVQLDEPACVAIAE
jgi:hypothetical protein